MVHFLLDQKSDDLFLVITLSYMVVYIIYCHQLPFYLICGGAPHQFSPIFASFQRKCLEKKIFVALGVHLHPLHSPSYAYECTWLGWSCDMDGPTVHTIASTVLRSSGIGEDQFSQGETRESGVTVKKDLQSQGPTGT